MPTFMHKILKFEAWNYFATHQKKLTTPWLRTAELEEQFGSKKLILVSRCQKIKQYVLVSFKYFYLFKMRLLKMVNKTSRK
jgi:hypothetical protein